MRSVGIKVLKNKLSEYVRAAAAGETVLVTDRDRVVAELVPPQQDRAFPLDPVLAQGVREGWYTPPTIPWTEPLPDVRCPPLVPFDELMEDIAKDREDR